MSHLFFSSSNKIFNFKYSYLSSYYVQNTIFVDKVIVTVPKKVLLNYFNVNFMAKKLFFWHRTNIKINAYQTNDRFWACIKTIVDILTLWCWFKYLLVSKISFQK